MITKIPERIQAVHYVLGKQNIKQKDKNVPNSVDLDNILLSS